MNKIYIGCLLILIATSYVLSSREYQVSDVEREQIITRINLLSPADKALLKDKLEHFRALSSHEQQKLRDFHIALDSHKDSTRLLNVLKDYNDWMKGLSTDDRVAVQAVGDAERLTEVRRILNAQLAERFKSLTGQELTPDDSGKLIQWVNDIHDKYGGEIEGEFFRIYDLLSEDEQEKLLKVENAEHSRTRSKLLMFYAIQRAPDFVKDLIPEWEQEEFSLLDTLSNDALEQFLEAEENERTDLILSWIESAIWLQFMFDVGIDDAELGRFFAEDLNEQERRMIEQSSTFRESLLFVYFNKPTNQNNTDSSQASGGEYAPGIGTVVVGAEKFLRGAIDQLLPDLDDEQLALLENLSPGAGRVFAAMEDTANEAEKVMNWMKNAVRSQFFDQGDIADEELQSFIESDLTEEEREYLKQVPALQYRKTLLFLYYQKQDELEKEKKKPAVPTPDVEATEQNPTDED